MKAAAGHKPSSVAVATFRSELIPTSTQYHPPPKYCSATANDINGWNNNNNGGTCDGYIDLVFVCFIYTH